MSATAAGRWGASAFALLAVAVTLATPESAGAEERAPQVVVMELDGAIDNVSARFLRRALDDAANDGAAVVIVRIDTPGGLLFPATRDMVGVIFESPVPVVAYVAPDGAQAASAGTFVAAATSLLAMAPTTNIGAAAVVGGGGEDSPKRSDAR